jgi:cell wall-associated NlpC family hydrolase
MAEPEQRAAVVREAESWLGTPYHHHGKIKGVGVDCGQILIKVYSAVGLCDDFDTGYYAPQWSLHHSAEQYLAWVKRYARQVAQPTGPGDFVLWQFGRTLSHSCIIVDWPGKVIHAHRAAGMVEWADASKAPFLDGDGQPRRHAFFTLWGG